MTILHTFSNAAEFSIETVTTTLNKFNPSYVPYSLSALGTAQSAEWPTPSSDQIWINWYNYQQNGYSGGSDGYTVDIRTSGGTLLVRMDLSAGSERVQLFGDTTVSGSFTGGNAANGKNSTLHFDYSVANQITVKHYRNGTLQDTVVAANTGGKDKPARFDNQGIDSGGDNYISELSVADSDNRGVRLAMLQPDADGAFGDWTGGFAEVSDDTKVSFVASNVANDESSWTMSNYGGPATPAAIQGVVGGIVAKRGSTGYTKVRQFVRIGGTKYAAGVTHDLTETAKSYHYLWAVNPATGVAWTTGELDALELGVEVIP